MTSAAEPCDNALYAVQPHRGEPHQGGDGEGRFENLPGAGEPLNLEEYFSTPEDLRMAYSILRNANCAPAEVELLNEVSRLERAVAETADVTARQSLQRVLTDRQMQLAVMLEHRSRRQK